MSFELNSDEVIAWFRSDLEYSISWVKQPIPNFPTHLPFQINKPAPHPFVPASSPIDHHPGKR